MKIVLRIFILLFFNQVLHSQDLNTSLIQNYTEYTSHHKERLFFTTHKKIFLINENIYFSGFIKNSQNTLSSSIVQVSLYNAQSNIIKSSLHPIEGQSYYGNLLLETPPGKYILTASTIDDTGASISNIITQPIVVNQLASQQLKIQADIIPELYIQPEGGELVAGFSNTIGFYISTIDPSSDFIKHITLKDGSGETVLDSIPIIGQNAGSFKLSPKRNESYKLIIHLESGLILTKKLPLPIIKEVYFTTNTLLNDKLLISYTFSDAFLNTTSTPRKDITIAIHNYDGINSITAPLNKSKGTIAIPKSSLHHQVNIISVFDKNLHILYERFMYNHVDHNDNILLINSKNENSDSIITTITSQKELKHLNFSITSFTDKQKTQLPIYSQLFSGYGKNIVFDDTFLFGKQSRKKDAQIDIVCISLGTSDLDWKKIISGSYKKVKKHTSNFSIRGQLKASSIEKPTTLTLYQKSIGTIYTSSINKDGTFFIKDLHLLKNEQIYYSILPKTLEDVSIDIDISPKIISKKTLDTTIYNSYRSWLIPKINKPEVDVIPFNPASDQEVLDEVTLTAKKKKVVFTRNPQLSEGMYYAKKVNKQLIKKYPKTSQYIRTLGFRVTADAKSGGFFVFGRSILDPPPIIFIDGFRSQGSIQDWLLSSIDEIYFEHMGIEGSSGGSLYIYTQKSGSYQSEQELGETVAYEGFTKKEPFFIDTSTIPSVVHWTPIALSLIHI